MHQRPALGAGEDGLIDGLGVFLAAEDQAAARSAQGFVGRGGHHIGIGNRIGMQPRCDQPGDVGHIHEMISPHLFGDRADALEIDDPRIGARPRKDHLRTAFHRLALELVVVDPPVGFAHPVGHDVVVAAGEVDR